MLIRKGLGKSTLCYRLCASPHGQLEITKIHEEVFRYIFCRLAAFPLFQLALISLNHMYFLDYLFSSLPRQLEGAVEAIINISIMNIKYALVHNTDFNSRRPRFVCFCDRLSENGKCPWRKCPALGF